jgi:hypothetical protein
LSLAVTVPDATAALCFVARVTVAVKLQNDRVMDQPIVAVIVVIGSWNIFSHWLKTTLELISNCPVRNARQRM